MTSASSSPLDSFSRGVMRGLALLAGLVFALSAFLIMVGALVVGLTAAVGWVLWSLLRGQRPAPIRFSWQSRRFHTGRAGAPPTDPEVVDVEVRELPQERLDRES